MHALGVTVSHLGPENLPASVSQRVLERKHEAADLRAALRHQLCDNTSQRSKTSRSNSQFCRIEVGQDMLASLRPCLTVRRLPNEESAKILGHYISEKSAVLSTAGCQRRADKRKWVRLLLYPPHSPSPIP